MHSQSRPAAPLGFHCEHTPGESRVLALVDHRPGPATLHAVLTCRTPGLADEAARVLQRALRVPADAWNSGPLEELCARLPHGAADSLRTAVGRALAGAWPVNGTPVDGIPVDGAPGREDHRHGERGHGDHDHGERGHEGHGHGDHDHGDHDRGERDHGRAAPAARLAELSGPVFRIALLREFHVHDRRALLKAAADEGWEPLPADQLGAHDRQDLIGATQWLAEHRGDIAGADTLADRSQAYRLTVDEDDELAGWSREEVVADFGAGWLRGAEAHRAAEPGVPGEPGDPERPDFAALFEVDAPHCADPECGEERCRWHLTPRTAAALHEALRLLARRAREDAAVLGDRPLAPGGLGEKAGVFTRLPRVTFGVGAAWRLRFARAVESIGGDLRDGWWPEPTCTAEEVALHLAIEDARAAVEAGAAAGTGPIGGGVLPAHRDDHDFDACAGMFFQDTDVLMLYDAGLDGMEDPEDEVNQRLGIGDLRPAAWFEPFLNVTPRDEDDDG
ncbi:hypothetical protein [Streptomyces sp. NPDC008125]|uniref:hypothetical protein n=1 Tax=Streptomyces sp. NPDC008125 TaxID=3364811 RepID=UPI0036E76D88